MPRAPFRSALVLALAVAGAVGTQAQGGLETLDPAYGGETARRGFYGGFALSGEASYDGANLVGDPGTTPGSNLSLAARLDYALLPQVDLALVADLTGGVRNGPLGLSWVVVKPYWHNEMTDYAIRVAVDPASEGGLGFRQTDVTFLSTTALSPLVTSDLSVGVRRVRTGFATLSEDDIVEPADPEPAAFAARIGLVGDPQRERLVGQEVRASWGYNVLFDPAGSRFALGLVAEAGDYAIVRTQLRAAPASGDGEAFEEEETGSRRIRSGTGWLRAGVEFSRPAYQLAPFVSVPVVRWSDTQGGAGLEGPRVQRVKAGLRLTLR